MTGLESYLNSGVYFKLGSIFGGTMRHYLVLSILVLILPLTSSAQAQQTPDRPGLRPYTPTQVEWLALAVNSQLRHDPSADSPYSLAVVQSDHETLLIFVRYHPTVNREIMNSSIDTAREVIMITAKSYGWDKWVKIRERVEMYPSKK